MKQLEYSALNYLYYSSVCVRTDYQGFGIMCKMRMVHFL